MGNWCSSCFGGKGKDAERNSVEDGAKSRSRDSCGENREVIEAPAAPIGGDAGVANAWKEAPRIPRERDSSVRRPLSMGVDTDRRNDLGQNTTTATRDNLAGEDGLSDVDNASGEKGTALVSEQLRQSSEQMLRFGMNMFSNATAFSVSGGNFYNVNGSMTVEHSIPSISSAAPLGSDSDDGSQQVQPTESEVYARHLFPKKNGYPLWKPDISRAAGISIGDVGYIDTNGQFYCLFNILHPATHPRNGPGHVPSNFEQLHVPDLEYNTGRNSRQYGPGAVVSNPPVEVRTFRSHELDDHSYISQKLENGDIPEEIGYGFQIKTRCSNGAILLLPEGAVRIDYRNEDLFETYIHKHAISWYTYVNGVLGHCLGGNALMLVTGVDNAKSWGVVAFSRSPPNSVSLDFIPGRTGAKYKFQNVCYAETDSGPRQAQVQSTGNRIPRGDWDHCVFVRGFRVAVREHDRHVEAQNLKHLKNSELLSNNESIPFRRHGYATDVSIGATNMSCPTETVETPSQNQIQAKFEISGETQDGTAESSPVPMRLPYHPGAVINDFLLKLFPGSTIVLIHDKTWFELLKNGEDNMPNDEELINRFKERCGLFPGGQPHLRPVLTQQDHSDPGNLKRIPSTGPLSPSSRQENAQGPQDDNSPPDSPTPSPLKAMNSESPLLDRTPDPVEQKSASSTSRSAGLTHHSSNNKAADGPNIPSFPELVQDSLLEHAVSELPEDIRSKIPQVGNSALSKPGHTWNNNKRERNSSDTAADSKEDE